MSAPSFVIGAGEVGRRIAAALEAAGDTVRLVGRTHGWDEALAARGALRVLSMREDDLPAALARFPAGDRPDLVLVQNGFLEPALGDLADVGRGLVWFTSKGDFFRVLQPTLLHGRHAERLAGALRGAGVAAEAVHDPGWFAREMVLKGAWNCVVGLPLAVHGMTLEGYLARRRDEAAAVAGEAAAAASAWYGVDVPPEEAFGRLLATTGPVGWMTGGTKALSWRNGAVATMGRARGIATPANDALLEAASR